MKVGRCGPCLRTYSASIWVSVCSGLNLVANFLSRPFILSVVSLVLSAVVFSSFVTFPTYPIIRLSSATRPPTCFAASVSIRIATALVPSWRTFVGALCAMESSMKLSWGRVRSNRAENLVRHFIFACNVEPARPAYKRTSNTSLASNEKPITFSPSNAPPHHSCPLVFVQTGFAAQYPTAPAAPLPVRTTSN